MTSQVRYHVYPRDNKIKEYIAAVRSLNNNAHRLEMSGDYVGAEEAHLQALEFKIKATHENSNQVALSKIALGELYLKMEGRLDDAKIMLEAADRIRSPENDFDAACTRDNLGRMWEMKGDLTKAREARGRNRDMMICSHFDCPKSSQCQISKESDLEHRGRCRCAFYCSVQCQKMDWRRRKVRYKQV